MGFFSDERANELRDLFFESAQELLQTLNDKGLELEQNPHDAEILRDIRRTVHTLKGDSAACGFRELSELAHEMEDALGNEAATNVDSNLIELVLHAADSFDSMLSSYRGHGKLPSTEHIRKLIQAPHSPAVCTERRSPGSGIRLERVRAARVSEKRG